MTEFLFKENNFTFGRCIANRITKFFGTAGKLKGSIYICVKKGAYMTVFWTVLFSPLFDYTTANHLSK